MRNIRGIGCPLRGWGLWCPLIIEVRIAPLGGWYPAWRGLAHGRGRGLIGIGHVMMVMHIVRVLGVLLI